MKYFSDKLWNNRKFNYLWMGMSVSLIGTEITTMALPTIALILLNATAMEVGILKAAESIAFPLLGLFAGVMADRLSSRLIMLVADVSRLFILLVVPLAYMIGCLNIHILLFVAIAMGIFTVFFNISYTTYIPAIVERDCLVQGNSKLELSQSAAQVIGPILAGWLIYAMGAVKSLFVDSLSYLFSSIALIMINFPSGEKVHEKKEALPRKSILEDIREGLKFVFSDKTLRLLAITTGFANLGFSIVQPMLLVLAYKQLGLSPQKVGVILSIGSIGLIIGSSIAFKSAQYFGLGKSMFLSMCIISFSTFIIPLSLLGIPEVVLALSWFFTCFGIPIYNINQLTLRQLVTPDELQGRMNATVRTIIKGVIPIGSLLGGILASDASLVTAFIVGGIVYLSASVLIYISHLYLIKDQPTICNDKKDAEVM